jgi:hypothetical protein
LPGANAQQAKVTESGKTVWEKGAFVSGAPGINRIAPNGVHLCGWIESGTYRFVVSPGTSE